VRWRTGRHREALWKSLVLPAGGVALCWILLMTLGLPILDDARSNRTIAMRIVQHVPPGSCVAAPDRILSFVAALEYYGRYRVDAGHDASTTRCDYLVRVEPRSGPPAAVEGWAPIARERRPSDRSNVVAIYRREAPA
jgi:hypothetical protein